MGRADKLLPFLLGDERVVKKSKGAQGVCEVVIEKRGRFSESYREEG